MPSPSDRRNRKTIRNPLWICLVGRLCIMLILALSCSNFFALTAFAQTVEESVEEEAAPAIDVAPVTIDGKDLFSVIGVSAEPAEKRAADIAVRIVEVTSSFFGDLRIVSSSVIDSTIPTWPLTSIQSPTLMLRR